jgi:hypothetical protein
MMNALAVVEPGATPAMAVSCYERERGEAATAPAALAPFFVFLLAVVPVGGRDANKS